MVNPIDADSREGVSLLALRNFRDLGGLATRAGRVLRSQRLYRSSALSRFGVAQREALDAIAPRSVIDLRSTAEVTQPANTISLPNARVAHLPLFESPRPNWVMPADQTPQATADRYFEMLHDGLPNAAAAVVQAAQPEATPLVVCCSAGRDRTGVVVACLLDLLDVPDESIAADYSRSDAFDQRTGRAHPETILLWLDRVRSHYGSVQQMFAPFGVTPTTLETLRKEFWLAQG